jgi:asparaginyl-tRNA synthetase
MKTIRISDIINYEGKEVESFVQATLIKNEMDENIFDKADNINYESSIKISGVVKEEKRVPLGYEVLVKNIEVVGMAADNYPISLKEHGTDTYSCSLRRNYYFI